MSTLVWDLIALAGLGLLTLGLWQLCPPLALIVAGAVFLVLGIWGAKLWVC